MQQTVRAAVAQIEIHWLKPQENLEKIVAVMDRIVKEGRPDLLVFPELSNSGYLKGRDSKDFGDFALSYYQAAERVPGPFTRTLGEHARKHHIHLVIGILEAHPSIPGALFNSAILINPEGEIGGIYRKAHIPSEEKHYFFPGDRVEVLPTELGKIGLLICADNSFPEPARVLSLQGAEIICVPYARPKGVGGDPDLYHRLVSCRAFENNNFFVTCNRVGKEGNIVFEGRSSICGPRGEFLAQSNLETEEIIRADLSAEVLIRARILHSRFRDRRPDLYGRLSQPLETGAKVEKNTKEVE